MLIFCCIGKIFDFSYTTKHIPYKIALQFWRMNNRRGMKSNLKGYKILIMPLLLYNSKGILLTFYCIKYVAKKCQIWYNFKSKKQTKCKLQGRTKEV